MGSPIRRIVRVLMETSFLKAGIGFQETGFQPFLPRRDMR